MWLTIYGNRTSDVISFAIKDLKKVEKLWGFLKHMHSIKVRKIKFIFCRFFLIKQLVKLFCCPLNGLNLLKNN